ASKQTSSYLRPCVVEMARPIARASESGNNKQREFPPRQSANAPRHTDTPQPGAKPWTGGSAGSHAWVGRWSRRGVWPFLGWLCGARRAGADLRYAAEYQRGAGAGGADRHGATVWHAAVQSGDYAEFPRTGVAGTAARLAAAAAHPPRRL